jgi:hypothetical protein
MTRAAKKTSVSGHSRLASVRTSVTDMHKASPNIGREPVQVAT